MLIAYQHTGNLSKQILVVRWTLYTQLSTSHGDQLMPHRGAEVSILKFALVPGSENLGTAINICALLF